MKAVNQVLSRLGTTIFTVMSALANEHNAINLGQGFPDEDGPEDVRRAAADALMAGPNQYAPLMGVEPLRRAVAEHDSHFYGLDTDWQSQTMITSGATEGLAASLLAFLNPGDEAVLFEPLYDSYAPIVRLAGATPRFVRLEPPNWSLPANLADAFSDKTKLVLLNTPANPACKVFARDELASVAELAIRYDAYVIADEVYEHLVFSGHEHIPICTLPGMAERTVRIGSAGKIFSLTGWKVAYMTGPAEIIGAIAKAHQYLTFATPPNLQLGVAHGLGKDDAFFTDYASELEAKRDLLAVGLDRAGFTVLDSHGTYFLNADFRPLGFEGDDLAFCQHITEHAGVAAVPVSAFYDADGPDYLARFCFCKSENILEQAINRLCRFFG